MKKKLITIFSAVLVLSMTLTACNLFGGKQTPGQPDPAVVGTMAAETVSARFTQVALETLVAQLTQAAQVTNTPVATSTPLPTNTPVATLVPTNTPIPPTKTPVPIPCYAASFIADVTIKDGTNLYAGDPFTKTWQIKNVGSCSWTKDYKIFFFGGNQMSAASAIAFPKTVNPGETVNLSVDMIAPTDTGNVSGSWMLKAANGTVFGVGSNYNVALTVEIKVLALPKSKDPNIVYDFVRKYCSADWRTNAKAIGCPSMSIDFEKGSIMRTYSPVLEGGYKDDEGALITVPATGGDGMIQGKFPKMLINAGDHFMALLICADGYSKCSVTYELLYSESGSDTVTSLGTWSRNYGDAKIYADVDLSALAGKEVNFYLKVKSGGNSSGDVAYWMDARITHP